MLSRESLTPSPTAVAVQPAECAVAVLASPPPALPRLPVALTVTVLASPKPGLVALDQLVNLEHVDLTAVQAPKALTDMLKQHAELLAVILTDDLAHLSPARTLLALSTVPATNVHGVARYLPDAVDSNPLQLMQLTYPRSGTCARMLSFSRPQSSMPDLLKDIRDQLDARLAELRPLVDEHDRLNAAMQALSEIKPRTARATPASSPVKTTSARAHKPPPAKRRKRAPRGANRQAVLQAASQRPGGTRAQLAAVSGVDPNTLSALLARLVKAGELQTRALPSGHTGYALADSAPAQPAGT